MVTGRNLFIGVVIVIILAAIALFYKSSYSNLSQPQSTGEVSQETGGTATSQTTSVNEITGEQNVITLTQDGFSPSTLTIKAGTKVTWANKSGDQATVNSNPHPVHSDYSPLNLGGFSDGSTLSLVFDKAGIYGYHNHLNPSQSGTIIVK